MFEHNLTPEALRSNILSAAKSPDPSQSLGRLGRALEETPLIDLHVRQALGFLALLPFSGEVSLETIKRRPEEVFDIKEQVAARNIADQATDLLKASVAYYVHLEARSRLLQDSLLATIVMCLNQLRTTGATSTIKECASALLPAMETTLGARCGDTFSAKSIRTIIGHAMAVEVPISEHLHRFYSTWMREFDQIYPEWTNESQGNE